MLLTLLFRRILLFVGILFFGCIEPYDTGIKDNTPELVVDGMISNLPGPYTIELSYSAPYSNEELPKRVSGARVEIKDDEGDSFVFAEAKAGVYVSDTSFRGRVGHTYTLHIQTRDGKTYKSKPEAIQSIVALDTAYSTPVYGSISQGVTGFKVFAKTKDPSGGVNFYRWKWSHYNRLNLCRIDLTKTPGNPFGLRREYDCCQLCWQITRCNNCIRIFSDQNINGNSFTQELTNIPYDAKTDYYMLIEQQSISKDAYEFWETVDTQINNTGGIFDTPPATVRGNIYNTENPNEQVLGLFSAAAIDRKYFYVKRNYVSSPPPFPNIDTTPVQKQPDCYPCQESALRTTFMPPGWKE